MTQFLKKPTCLEAGNARCAPPLHETHSPGNVAPSLRGSFESVFEEQIEELAHPTSSGPETALMAVPVQLSPEAELEAKLAPILAHKKIAPLPNGPADASRAPTAETKSIRPKSLLANQSLADHSCRQVTEALPGGLSHWFVSAVLVFLLILAGRTWNQYADARDRAAAALTKRLALKERCGLISTDLEEMLAVRSQIEVDQNRLARISADQTNPRWTFALRFVEPDIEIREMHANARMGDSDASEVRIQGVSGGAEPRLTAEQYRKMVEKILVENAKGRPTSTRLELLADVAGAVSEEPRIAFVVIATIDSSQAPVVMSREER